MIRHAKYCSAVHGTLDAINAKKECIAFWLEGVYRQKYKKKRERERKEMGLWFCRKGRERRTEKRIDIDDIHTASSSSSR